MLETITKVNISELSVMIICQNEEDKILIPIKNIYDYCKEIIIMDGGSKDNTLQVLRDFKNNNDIDKKLRVFQNTFNNNFSDQKNLGMSKVKNLWTLSLDADEYLESAFLKVLPDLD